MKNELKLDGPITRLLHSRVVAVESVGLGAGYFLIVTSQKHPCQEANSRRYRACHGWSEVRLDSWRGNEHDQSHVTTDVDGMAADASDDLLSYNARGSVSRAYFRVRSTLMAIKQSWFSLPRKSTRSM